MASDALNLAVQKLIDAATEYWSLFQKEQKRSAVVWIQGSPLEPEKYGPLVIVTRGEYRDTLMNNIDRVGPSLSFGAVPEDQV